MLWCVNECIECSVIMWRVTGHSRACHTLQGAPTPPAQATRVVVWGTSSSGQLGTGRLRHVCPFPQEITEARNATHIACGEEFTLAMVEDSLLGWGLLRERDPTKDGKATKHLPVPAPRKLWTAPTGTKVLQMHCGQLHSLLLLDNGQVMAMGANNEVGNDLIYAAFD